MKTVPVTAYEYGHGQQCYKATQLFNYSMAVVTSCNEQQQYVAIDST